MLERGELSTRLFENAGNFDESCTELNAPSLALMPKSYEIKNSDDLATSDCLSAWGRRVYR